MAAAAPQTLAYEGVEVGVELPVLEIPITVTAIVSGALASRDYQEVHHDPDLAKERGSPDIFMNILTTNGLISRYVNDWAGPEARFRGIQIKLGAPNYPGDTMNLSGQVASKSLEDGAGRVDVALVGKNGIGKHVTATVQLVLPTD